MRTIVVCLLIAIWVSVLSTVSSGQTAFDSPVSPLPEHGDEGNTQDSPEIIIYDEEEEGKNNRDEPKDETPPQLEPTPKPTKASDSLPPPPQGDGDRRSCRADPDKGGIICE